MKKSNIIPENIIFIYNLNKGKDGVYPAFPIQEGNKGRLETAREWASQYVQENRKYIKSTEGVREEILENKSEFIKSVKLVNIEKRGNGGRAWKVIINNKFLIDLREYSLFNSLLLDGCDKGGFLKGNFIFANDGAEFKLLNKNSSDFEAIKGFKEEVDAFCKLDKKNIGILWETKQNKYIYLGYVELEINSFELVLLKENRVGEIYDKREGDSQRKKEKILIFLNTWGEGKETLNYSYARLNILKNTALGKESFKFDKKDIEEKLDHFCDSFKKDWKKSLDMYENKYSYQYRECSKFLIKNNFHKRKEELLDEIFNQLKKQYSSYE